MSKDRRLGRGLAALLGGGSSDDPDLSGADTTVLEPPTEAAAAVTLRAAEMQHAQGRTSVVPPSAVGEANNDQALAAREVAPESGDACEIPVERIDANPYQPRRTFDECELKELAASLDEHQMLQPVLVRQVGSRYQLISGERRLRAAILAGWAKIPARVRTASDQEAAELAMVENLQRKDLSPIEKAKSFRQYLEAHSATQEELAKRLKVDRSTVANLVRLLDLPSSVQHLVDDGKLGAGHARALLALSEPALQTAFGQRIVTEGWSVRETERQVRSRIKDGNRGRLSELEKSVDQVTKKHRKDRQVASLETDLRRALGTKVEIQQSGKHKGRVVIHFQNQGEFERLFAALTDGRVRTDAA